jgi:methyl-accepting chemotaxis protein
LVRSLAQRSASAANEIKHLIGASVERVDAGARLVDEAGSTMLDIVSSVAPAFRRPYGRRY